ncbi:MAG TPA: hypothetical protein VJ934_04015 [Desulfomicrobiaceae bacterium]|nr:hypothetical protein [Desulfomicrobiaceae bacterium]
MQSKSRAYRWGSFFAGSLIIYLVCFVLGAKLVQTVPAMRRMAEFVDESGIETGEFYYTDVEIVGHADIGARSTFEHTPRGPQPE